MRNDSQVASDELAAYFRSPDYRDELERQGARFTARVKRQRQDFGLAKYWRDHGYAHAADVAAALTRTQRRDVEASGSTIPTRPQDSAA